MPSDLNTLHIADTFVRDRIYCFHKLKHACCELSLLSFIYPEPTAPLNVRTQSVDNVSAVLQWSQPDPPNGVITHYNVRYWKTGQMETMKTNTDVMQLSHRVTGLKASTAYQFQVITSLCFSVYVKYLSIHDSLIFSELLNPKSNLKPINERQSWCQLLLAQFDLRHDKNN